MSSVASCLGAIRCNFAIKKSRLTRFPTTAYTYLGSYLPLQYTPQLTEWKRRRQNLGLNEGVLLTRRLPCAYAYAGMHDTEEYNISPYIHLSMPEGLLRATTPTTTTTRSMVTWRKRNLRVDMLCVGSGRVPLSLSHSYFFPCPFASKLAYRATISIKPHMYTHHYRHMVVLVCMSNWGISGGFESFKLRPYFALAKASCLLPFLTMHDKLKRVARKEMRVCTS